MYIAVPLVCYYLCAIYRVFSHSVSRLLFITPLWNRRSHCCFTDEGTEAERGSTSATIARSWRQPDLLHFPTQPPKLGCRVSPSKCVIILLKPPGVSPKERPTGEVRARLCLLRPGPLYVCRNPSQIFFYFITLRRVWAQRALQDKVSSLILKWPTSSSTVGCVGPGGRRLTPPLLLSRWGILTTTLRGNEGW